MTLPIQMEARSKRLPVAPGQHVLIRDPSDGMWCCVQADPSDGMADRIYVSWIGHAYTPPHIATGKWFITGALDVYPVEPHQFDAAVMAARHLPRTRWYDWCATFVQSDPNLQVT